MRPRTLICLTLALAPVPAVAEEPPAWVAPWRGGERNFLDDDESPMRLAGVPAEPWRPRLVRFRSSFVPELIRATEDI